MFLINIAPIWWDLIILAILVIGFVIGLFLGLRATIFLLFGNLASLGLAFAFEGLILPSLVTTLSNLSAIQSQTEFGTIIANNLAPTLYFAAWVIGCNFLLVIIFLILKLTVLKKHKVKHKVVNICGGALVNLFRYSFLGGFVALFIGSGLIANKATGIDNYYQNEITTNSVAYRFFHGIYPNYPLFAVSNSDFQSAAALKNYEVALQYLNNEFTKAQNAALAGDYSKLDSTYADFNQYFPFTETEATAIKEAITKIKNHDVTSEQQFEIIAKMIKQRIGLDWSNVTFMNAKLIMIQNFLTLYPSTSNFFINAFKNAGSIDVTDSVIAPLFTELKPALENFLTKIPAADQAPMKQALADFYQGWTPTQFKFNIKNYFTI